jgi:hypothetical protein
LAWCEVGVAPTGLGWRWDNFPALAHWAIFWRAYGAHGNVATRMALPSGEGLAERDGRNEDESDPVVNQSAGDGLRGGLVAGIRLDQNFTALQKRAKHLGVCFAGMLVYGIRAAAVFDCSGRSVSGREIMGARTSRN